jgi:hypothetical protein
MAIPKRCILKLGDISMMNNEGGGHQKPSICQNMRVEHQETVKTEHKTSFHAFITHQASHGSPDEIRALTVKRLPSRLTTRNILGNP